MAPSRPVRLCALCAATLIGLASGVAAAEDNGVIEPPYRYLDLRVGVVSAPAPEIRQTRPGGYGWKGGDSRGTRFSIALLKGKAEPDDLIAWVYGASFSLGTYNVSDENNGIADRDLEQYMGDLYYGFQYGIVQTESIRAFAEFLPFVGVGATKLNLIDNDGNTESHLGPAYEAGLKFGGYVTERGWTAGITSSLLWNFTKVKSDRVSVNGRTNGFTFGGEFGYRF